MRWYETFILSCMEICCLFILWDRIDDRFKGKYLYIFISTIFLALLSVITINHNINFIFIYLAILVVTKIMFKVPFSSIFFSFIISFMIIIGVQMSGTYIFTLFYKSLNYSFPVGLIINMVTIIICMIIRNTNVLEKIRNRVNKFNNIFVIVLFNIVFVAVAFLYVWENNKDIVWNYSFVWLFAVACWTIINFYILFQTIKIKEQEEKLYIHERYVPFLTELVEEARRKQHDYANHLNAIYGLTELDDSNLCKKEIRKYLKGLIRDFKTLDKILAIRESVLSAIIYSKRALAESQNISFKLEIINQIPHYPVEDYELVEILGNLLDNAIEAINLNNTEFAKEVILTLGEEEEKKVIEVKNSGEPFELKNIETLFEKGFSTKKGKHRGYGLYNVKKVVNKYNGTIELSLADNYTIFRVLF